MDKIKLLAGAFALAFSAVSNAAIIQMDFTGQVYDITHYSGVSIDDSFNFTFTYDTDAPSNGGTGYYPQFSQTNYQGLTAEPIELSGSVGGLDFYTNNSDEIKVFNDFNSVYDGIHVISGDVILDDIFRGVNSFFAFDIKDNTALSFTDTELPSADILNNGNFDEIYWSLSGFHDAGGLEHHQFSIYGRGSFIAQDITSVPAPPAPVPEPPAIALLLTGVLGLFFARKTTSKLS